VRVLSKGVEDVGKVGLGEGWIRSGLEVGEALVSGL